MNISFLLTFVNITDINNNLYDLRYFEFNSTKLSTNELNYIIWNNFSSLFNDKSFITMDDIIYTVGIEKESLINLFRLITSKNFIDYNNFSDFLNKVHDHDYIKLIKNIPNDNLSTPSDWSSIGSDYDSDDSIINIEDNIKINIQETIENPISPQPKQSTKSVVSLGNKNTLLNTGDLSIDKLSPKTSSTEKIISEQPNPVKFYDPNSIPKPKPRSKPKSRYHFCQFEYSSEKQHSWYIECFLYIHNWFTTQKYIGVPNWIKKYF
tara:strand:- start:4945 stop:5739 length:795 start_codon:yes stop_codon:yes gene_type:complete